MMEYRSHGTFEQSENRQPMNRSPTAQGGGYMKQSTFASPGHSESPSGARPRKVQSLSPVSIKQILEAKADNSQFIIDGRQVGQVTFVALVLSIKHQQTSIGYIVDDGSAKFVAYRFIGSENEMDQQASEVKENGYYRFYGTISDLNGGAERTVTVYQVNPIVDFNEVTYHNLEVIHAHLQAMRPKADASGFGGGGRGNLVAADQLHGDTGFTDLQTQIINAFRSDAGNEQGTTIDYIQRKLPQVPRNQLREAIEYLTTEGHLYSTVDEDHYRLTNEA